MSTRCVVVECPPPIASGTLESARHGARAADPLLVVSPLLLQILRENAALLAAERAYEEADGLREALA
jgi:hypothetical protein